LLLLIFVLLVCADVDEVVSVEVAETATGAVAVVVAVVPYSVEVVLVV
jgi:hypothetical protein